MPAFRHTRALLLPVVAAAASAAVPAFAQEAAAPELADRDRPFVLRPTAYLQLDGRNFLAWEPTIANVHAARDLTEVRRARVGVRGSYRRFDFEIDLDPSDGGEILKDAFGQVRLRRGLRVRAGHLKLPFSQEQLTSAARIDFLERSLLATALDPDRDLGVVVVGRGRLLDYEIGAFAGDARSGGTGGGATLAGRVTAEPLDGLEIGTALTWGDVSEEAGDRPRGLSGRAASGYRFFPAHHVGGQRLRLGADAEWSRGPFALRTRAGIGRESRQGQGVRAEDLPPLETLGVSASGHWLLRGERRGGRVRPGRSAIPGLGAVELSVRYDALRFDDAGPETGEESPFARAGDVRRTSARALTGGLSWWPASWLRVLGNLGAERYGPEAVAPDPARRGPYLTGSVRVQLHVP